MQHARSGAPANRVKTTSVMRGIYRPESRRRRERDKRDSWTAQVHSRVGRITEMVLTCILHDRGEVGAVAASGRALDSDAIAAVSARPVIESVRIRGL
jgi:hypothetical protein